MNLCTCRSSSSYRPSPGQQSNQWIQCQQSRLYRFLRGPRNCEALHANADFQSARMFAVLSLSGRTTRETSSGCTSSLIKHACCNLLYIRRSAYTCIYLHHLETSLILPPLHSQQNFYEQAFLNEPTPYYFLPSNYFLDPDSLRQHDTPTFLKRSHAPTMVT